MQAEGTVALILSGGLGEADMSAALGKSRRDTGDPVQLIPIRRAE